MSTNSVIYITYIYVYHIHYVYLLNILRYGKKCMPNNNIVFKLLHLKC